jgi:hypothetical protein
LQMARKLTNRNPLFFSQFSQMVPEDAHKLLYINEVFTRYGKRCSKNVNNLWTECG